MSHVFSIICFYCKFFLFDNSDDKKIQKYKSNKYMLCKILFCVFIKNLEIFMFYASSINNIFLRHGLTLWLNLVGGVDECRSWSVSYI